MKKQNQLVLEKIIRLPKEYSANHNIFSIYDLLRNTGYFDVYHAIDSKKISRLLNDEYVQDWIGYSENKRVDSGWFFIQKDVQRYVVGYLDFGLREREINYSDGKIACGIFIKNEIEEIRNS